MSTNKILNFETIKDGSDIVTTISHYIEIGKGNKCVCPFHDDKKPSLSITSSKGLWNCPACRTGGDAIKFVMEYNKLNYKDALVKLADINGISVEYGKNKDHKTRSRTYEAFKNFIRLNNTIVSDTVNTIDTSDTSDTSTIWSVGDVDFIHYLEQNFIDTTYAKKVGFNKVKNMNIYEWENNFYFSQSHDPELDKTDNKVNFTQYSPVLFGGKDIKGATKNDATVTIVASYKEVVRDNYKSVTSSRNGGFTKKELDTLCNNDIKVTVEMENEEERLNFARQLSLYGVRGDVLTNPANHTKIPLIEYCLTRMSKLGYTNDNVKTFINGFANPFDRDEAIFIALKLTDTRGV